MQLTEIAYKNSPPIDGYGAGFFRIGGQVHRGSLLVLGANVTPWAGYEDTQMILSCAADIDVLFVGTGAQMQIADAAFTQKLEAAGIGVESMNAPTACRTYNVVLSEGRRVGLALFPL